MDTTRVDDGIVEGDGPAVRLGGKFRSTIDAVEYGSGEIPFPVVLFYLVAPEFNGFIVDDGDGSSAGTDGPTCAS